MAQTKAQLVVGLDVNASAPASALQIDASGNVNLDSNTLYVDATNNRVGIGTSSPAYPLHVSTTSVPAIGAFRAVDVTSVGTAGQEIYFGALNGSTPTPGASITGRLDNPATTGDLFFSTRLGGTLSPRMFISSGGNVGIGTTSPNANSQLHIAGSSYQPLYVNTTASDGGGAAFLRSGTQALYVGTAGGNWLTGSSTADGLIRSEANLIFATGGNTQRAQIDSSGRLLVGTSTTFDQSAPLQVNSSTGYSANLYVFGADNSQVNIGSARGSVGSPSTLNSSDTIGGIYFRGHDGTSFKTGAQIQAQIDGITPSSDLPSRLVFSTTADGASSPTEQLRITSDRYVRLASGTGGIQFNGDTSATNALDDYEEGTWTPTIIGGTTNGTVTYAYQSGSYVKVGGKVTLTWYVQWTAGTGSGILLIGNLPFSTANDLTRITTGSVMMDSVSYSADYVVPYSQYGTSEISLYGTTAGTGWAAIPYDAAGAAIGHLTYRTN